MTLDRDLILRWSAVCALSGFIVLACKLYPAHPPERADAGDIQSHSRLLDTETAHPRDRREIPGSRSASGLPFTECGSNLFASIGATASVEALSGPPQPRTAPVLTSGVAKPSAPVPPAGQRAICSDPAPSTPPIEADGAGAGTYKPLAGLALKSDASLSPTSGVLLAAGAWMAKDRRQPGASCVGRTRNAGPRTITSVVTAYCDHSQPCADGKPAGPGRVAAPRWIPLGTRAYIPGYGRCVVADRTAKRFNGRWDVHLDTRRQCIDWGKRIVKVTVTR